MKAFTYQRVDSTAQAAAAALKPGTKIIAGGTNLLDLMKLQIETPSNLVDINDCRSTRSTKLPMGACVSARWSGIVISPPTLACGSVTAC